MTIREQMQDMYGKLHQSEFHKPEDKIVAALLMIERQLTTETAALVTIAEALAVIAEALRDK